MIHKNQVADKQQIIKEYLGDANTYADLGKKYGIPGRTIQTWVRAYRKKHPDIYPLPERLDNSKDLKKSLEHAVLKNELLEEMIRLAEEQTGIDFRKKFGARQS